MPSICESTGGLEDITVVCVWPVAEEAVGDASGMARGGVSWLHHGRDYRSGAVLFVVGNMIAFSFPIWMAMGADVVTITGVIIVGELLEVMGIYLLGEQALHAIKARLAEVVDAWRTRLRRWSEHTAESWMPVSLPVWN